MGGHFHITTVPFLLEWHIDRNLAFVSHSHCISGNVPLGKNRSIHVHLNYFLCDCRVNGPCLQAVTVCLCKWVLNCERCLPAMAPSFFISWCWQTEIEVVYTQCDDRAGQLFHMGEGQSNQVAHHSHTLNWLIAILFAIKHVFTEQLWPLVFLIYSVTVRYLLILTDQ